MGFFLPSFFLLFYSFPFFFFLGGGLILCTSTDLYSEDFREYMFLNHTLDAAHFLDGFSKQASSVRAGLSS